MDKSYLTNGAVYIFENSEAGRVKVGLTCIGLNQVVDRLRDINDMWLGRKATCQICGGRRLVDKVEGLLPQHVVSGIRCPGTGALPLEKDITLAESYLEKMKNRLSELSGVEKKSTVRRVNTLEKRIDKFRYYNGPVGEWQSRVIFYTKGAERVEPLSHEILAKYLDKQAPFGEIFCCSVSVATEAVETALSQLGLLDSVRKENK
ncbi:hypothetical protein ACFL3D_02450 [Candidatus Omnitrophota bacterium]